MLVLSRKEREELVITVPPGASAVRIVVSVLDIDRNKTRLGIIAPDAVKIYRAEIQAEIDAKATN